MDTIYTKNEPLRRVKFKGETWDACFAKADFCTDGKNIITVAVFLITSLSYTFAYTIHSYHIYEGTELMFSNFPQDITLEVPVLKLFYIEVKNKLESNTG